MAEGAAWPADLVGYSMGGRLALHFAAAFPARVRRLVLESSSPGLATQEERAERRNADEALAERIEAHGIEGFVEEWERLPLFGTQGRLAPATRAALRTARLANRPESLAAALRGLGTGALPSLWERLPELVTPTLLLVGEEDRRFVHVAHEAAARMPAAEIVVVPGAGHAVHLERPDAWVEAVAAFLSGH